MVQVIFHFKEGKYPFESGKKQEQTYMEYLLVPKNQDQASIYRQLNSIYKKIDNINIMKLKRILKQNQTFHMQYEYQDKPLQKRLGLLVKQKQLADLFVELQNVFETLIQQKLKAQLYIQFMGVDQNNHLKVWIKPDQVQFLGSKSSSQKQMNQNLYYFYEIQRTRIHLGIEEIIKANQYFNSKQKCQKKNSSNQKNADNTSNSSSTKGKIPNLVIEVNTLVSLNTQTQKSKGNTCNESEYNNKKQKNLSSKVSHGYSQQISKAKQQSKEANVNPKNIQKATAYLNKTNIPQKVLSNKKDKPLVKQSVSQDQKNLNLIIKDSSTSNASQNDESKQQKNDSDIHIKSQMINKHKFRITTSQQVEIQGNSDDDLQKLARQKIAQINKQKFSRSHDIFRSSNITEAFKDTQNSLKNGNQEIFLKDLEENSRQQKVEESNTNISSKFNEAKLKAKQIILKYGKN